jgi:hypothetical protein
METILTIYKVRLPGGIVTFEAEESGQDVTHSASTIGMLAKSLGNIIGGDLKEKGSSASLVFSTTFRIECPVNLTPRFCEPLNPKEMEEFWEHFSTL